jgi:hypothetical protein
MLKVKLTVASIKNYHMKWTSHIKTFKNSRIRLLTAYSVMSVRFYPPYNEGREFHLRKGVLQGKSPDEKPRNM